MMNAAGDTTKLLPGEQERRRNRNKEYMMSLKSENLLLAHYFEAGLKSMPYKPEGIHWGWDSPLSEIRGTLTGHWLSAAAYLYAETKDKEIKTKADFIVSEIGKCQKENGGEWAFPIPEKYLYWLKRKKNVWAPQYVCHKIMMGLLDMYLFGENEEAYQIVLKCADWFYRYTDDISRELMDEMMDMQETGGMMHHFASLYQVTKDEKHLTLMKRYERPKLFEPILEGKDILTNMHVNTTVPEILGAAAAYEATGEDRYLRIVKNYWELAVTERGMYATGSQSCGEVWTPKNEQSARLGKMNQEHCVVYNMMLLAEYLFRFTGKAEYADYWERNLYNGIFAQGYWESSPLFGCCEGPYPEKGLILYYLPLAAGSQKKWGSETEHFWCCHCTLLQANAIHNRAIYYQKDDEITIAQYLPSETSLFIKNTRIHLKQEEGNKTGESIRILPEAYEQPRRPDQIKMEFTITADEEVSAVLRFRMPWWLKGEAVCIINGKEVNLNKDELGFANIDGQWKNDKIIIILPKGLMCWLLPDKEDTVAFLDGPVLLAGLVPEERLLYGDIDNPDTMLTPENERQWCSWQNTYRTTNQPVGFLFKPLYEIGNEIYTVYFQVKHETCNRKGELQKEAARKEL